MIWLTWRQFRAQAAVAFAALAVVAIALTVTGAHLAHLYATSGVATCHAHGDCTALTGAFLNQVNASVMNHLPLLFGTALVAVPAIIGMFWGAPLVTRELEAGTHRLTWNQSITRTRWLTVKLALTGLAATAAAGLFSLMVTWAASPIDTVNMDRLLPALFSQRGIAPAGYAAFAFALGVTAGMLIRRTVAAMAVTLAVFTAAQFAMRSIRPHLITPFRFSSVITAASNISVGGPVGVPGGSMSVTGTVNIPGAWIYSDQTINAAGQVVGSVPLPATGALSVATCAGAGQGQGPAPADNQACLTELARLGYRQLVTYQPASRYWAFQWYETAIFLALTLAMAGFCFWWIRRRLS